VPETLRQLRERIGSAPCTDSSQCRTVAVGAKACGGPDHYLAFSTAHTRPEEVGALAQRYKEERLAANAASGELSNCRLMTDPGATCQPTGAGQRACVLGVPGGSSPSGDAR
jgi:hypothetical protein